MKATVTTAQGVQEIKFMNQAQYIRWYSENRKNIITMTLTK
jgi:hypothetical protein